jgi:DNA-binding NarL/FixJ family response regulator
VSPPELREVATAEEIEVIREKANFTERQKLVFDMRLAGYSLIQIADRICRSIDLTRKESQRVNALIDHFLDMHPEI